MFKVLAVLSRFVLVFLSLTLSRILFDCYFKTDCKLFIQYQVLNKDRCFSRNVRKTKKTRLRRINYIFHSLNYDVNIVFQICIK